MVCPKSNSHLYKLKKVGHRRAYLFLFCYLGSKEVLLLGEECPMFQKMWWWAKQCASTNKKSVGPPMNWLIWIIPTHKNKREAPSLHLTSHWLHGNSIPKIGCHYFWPRLSNSPS
jgi:hypothetical protein